MNTKEQLLNALQTEKDGDWDKAHQIVQVMEHPLAYWIHAYLHRKEPDIMNARYWYSRAGKSVPHVGFDHEWLEIFDFIQAWNSD